MAGISDRKETAVANEQADSNNDAVIDAEGNLSVGAPGRQIGDLAAGEHPRRQLVVQRESGSVHQPGHP